MPASDIIAVKKDTYAGGTCMMNSRATLGRLPIYLEYLKKADDTSEYVSASAIARALGLGEVQVRKDLSSVSPRGKPKIGYLKKDLIDDLMYALGYEKRSGVIIVGAGKLGRALLEFDGFSDYGLEILAAFDSDISKCGKTPCGKPVFPISDMRSFCQIQDVHIGIITAPPGESQKICDLMVADGITLIWNFAPVSLSVPSDVAVKNENLALSLAHLKSLSKQ